VDFLGDLPGVGDFGEAVRRSELAEMSGFSCRYLTLDALIAAKTAAGRPKDRRAVELLERIKRERENPSS